MKQEDVEFLRDLLVDRDRPVLEQELVDALIASRFQREEQRIRRELSRGAPYQPEDTYAVGETIVFPALEFSLGTVVSIRPGRNPEHGEFDVISVEIEGSDLLRSFAAQLKTPHKLNQSGSENGWQAEDMLDAEDLTEQYGRSLRPLLHEQLLNLPDSPFINLVRHWSVADLLADVHVGHLNIAEALIEVQARPMTTAELLQELDLPREIPMALLAFSLDFALSEDERFVDVGTEGREWYLERLLPEEAIRIPRRLLFQDSDFDRSLLTVPLLQLEWELDDEWTEGGASSVGLARLPSVELTLTYPHRRSGTVPVTDRTRGFFPVKEEKRSQITFIDGRWGSRFPGWVVPDGRYVCGLSQWYEEHKIPVGALILLERTDNPAEVVIDLKPRRMKREWVRMARADGDALAFQLQKQAVSCEFDDLMIVAEADPEGIDELRRRLYQQGPSVAELVEDLAPQLMGLSTQGTVSAKTVYSAINLIRRTAPGPVFAALVGSPRFQETGGTQFAMARA
ncbi:MAG: hypothetical protein U9R25_19690 [Chloroflexota bacterium]|nr:hypothetical protein [Chloroflexota bacterium]